jgi:GTP-binding protein
VLHISAIKRQGLGPVWKAIADAHASAIKKMPTPVLTRLLQEAVEHQAPKRAGAFRPKLRYAHQGGVNPPLVVVHGSALDKIPDSYRRYLEHFLLEAFQLRGTPLRIQFKQGVNPYADATARR